MDSNIPGNPLLGKFRQAKNAHLAYKLIREQTSAAILSLLAVGNPQLTGPVIAALAKVFQMLLVKNSSAGLNIEEKQVLCKILRLYQSSSWPSSLNVGDTLLRELKEIAAKPHAYASKHGQDITNEVLKAAVVRCPRKYKNSAAYWNKLLTVQDFAQFAFYAGGNNLIERLPYLERWYQTEQNIQACQAALKMMMKIDQRKVAAEVRDICANFPDLLKAAVNKAFTLHQVKPFDKPSDKVKSLNKVEGPHRRVPSLAGERAKASRNPRG